MSRVHDALRRAENQGLPLEPMPEAMPIPERPPRETFHGNGNGSGNGNGNGHGH